jgi:hypothetical protein
MVIILEYGSSSTGIIVTSKILSYLSEDEL